MAKNPQERALSFANAAMLWTLPLYLALILFIYYIIRRRTSFDFPPAAFVPPPATWRSRATRLFRLLPLLSGLLLLIALSHPQSVEVRRQLLPSGIDIIVALDVSGSMAAEDFQPRNRLEVAKDVLHNFIAARPSDRIGLVMFAGKSVTRSPLTLQHASLLQTLQTVKMGDLPEGTAIGSAIMSGVNRLISAQTQTSSKKGEEILVLLTDGRNNAGEIHPLDALNIAVSQKIKIYTIGVGSMGTVPFPIMVAPGKKGYRYEKVDMDEDLLERIAEQSGGKYFRASDPKSLQLLFTQINKLEKSDPEVVSARVIESGMYAAIVPAALLAFGYLILTTFIVRYP
jgi:Ca-activated chloride channel homolog